MSISDFAGLFALLMLAIQIASCSVAAWRCSFVRQSRLPVPGTPPVTLVRTLCGTEPFSRLTLESGFKLRYPAFQMLFCVEKNDDPIAPIVQSLMEQYPTVNARILFGRDRIGDNPKLNNMLKGWIASSEGWIVFADSNIILPADYLQRLFSSWRSNTGAVSSPPAGGYAKGFWAEVECGLLNSHQARWQYLVDAGGWGFAQGKTLMFRRRDLEAIGFKTLASEPAEDAAATKAVRRMGLRVSLAGPPFMQPLGRRTFAEVWARHIRWARLRRQTFPLLFAVEIFAGAALPILACTMFASQTAAGILPFVIAYALVWYGFEAILSMIVGWNLSALSIVAWILRDIGLPFLWMAAWFGDRISWRGSVVSLENNRQPVDGS